MNREIANHLSSLMTRLLFIEAIDAEHAPNRGRQCEHAAITWAIETLGAQYPAELAEGERIADERQQRRLAMRGHR